MAALPERYANSGHSLIELRDLTPDHLSNLLEEEIEAWRGGLDWDFRPSAELVRRFIQLRALTGYALVLGGDLAGYSYYVAEEGKGLIGDFYVRAVDRTVETEDHLLQAVLDSMWQIPGMRRVEAQLMMLSSQLDRPVPYSRWFQMYPRRFLEASLSIVESLTPREIPGVSFSLWTENRQDEAARLIPTAYRGHIDAHINDQYRSPGGARRFLANIVQYPGCGAFHGPASWVAWDRASHTLCGISLASRVADQTGHITQICVAPTHQKLGIGYELLRRSLASLKEGGCERVSLTVTDVNEAAIQLYQRMGFGIRRNFAAYVWEKK
jgi:ribosomal protein S18 acetylase RimI-like enzyme